MSLVEMTEQQKDSSAISQQHHVAKKEVNRAKEVLTPLSKMLVTVHK